jgi:aspartate carbamoyltransferase regulatory subunit
MIKNNNYIKITETFNADDLAAMIVDAIFEVKTFDRKQILSIVTSCIQKRCAQKLVPRNFSHYISKKKKASWLHTIKDREIQIHFWKEMVEKLDPDNMPLYYEERERILFEKGFRVLPEKETQITCFYCERVMDAAEHFGENGIHCTMDHVVPKSKFGPGTHKNIVNACNECNWLKSDLSLERFIKRLEEMTAFETAYMSLTPEMYPVIIKNAKKLLLTT